jgi:hypothetical protein
MALTRLRSRHVLVAAWATRFFPPLNCGFFAGWPLPDHGRPLLFRDRSLSKGFFYQAGRYLDIRWTGEAVGFGA